MEIAINIITAILSLASLGIALRRRHDARGAILSRICDDAIAYAKASKQPGIPLEKTALEAAILADLKDNGKRDFTDAQLLIAIRGRLHASAVA